MKIIKSGDLDKKPFRKLTCSHCKCEFEYNRADIRNEPHANQLSQLNNPLKYVECPNCENQIRVSK